MKITTLTIKGLRAFDTVGPLTLSPRMNVFVGPNNSGKSTILRTILALQNFPHAVLDPDDPRRGCTQGIAEIEFDTPDHPFIAERLRNRIQAPNGSFKIIVRVSGAMFRTLTYTAMNGSDSSHNFEGFPAAEPDHLTNAHFSNRKATSYNESVRRADALQIMGNHNNLYARVDEISNRQSDGHDEYSATVKDILGIEVYSIGGLNGKKAGIVLGQGISIATDHMGDGVTNIIGLLVDLCRAKDRLFVIEEPENDVHPQALKKLLGMMAAKSETNQFFVSTHSNIVLKHLAAIPTAKVFNVEPGFEGRLPTSKVSMLAENAEARREMLEQMGYELADSDVWSAWLLLEESTAETIVRDFLIPWFAPELAGRIRTYAASGVDQLEEKLDGLVTLFTYVHLTPAYRKRAWVLVDGDEKGTRLIERLRQKFPDWPQHHFQTLEHPCFEMYYPAAFSRGIQQLTAMHHGAAKQQAKSDLLQQVTDWLRADRERGMNALRESASRPIQILQSISASLPK